MLQVSKSGQAVKPEVMIPLVGHVVEFTVGTMIEVPRGAVTADEIAKEAEFFSFGTNDLTQMGFGLSRDDAAKFLLYYQEHGLIERDPFITLDADGVGKLVKIGVEKGRSVKPFHSLSVSEPSLVVPVRSSRRVSSDGDSRRASS